MRMDVGGQKRRRLYVLLAAYLDAGVNDPSIRELRQRAGLKDARVVLQLLHRLEEDGWIAIRPGGRGERNRYVLWSPDGH